jgi:hypothetical protein
MWQAHSSPDPIQCAAVLGPIKAEPFGWAAKTRVIAGPKPRP